MYLLTTLLAGALLIPSNPGSGVRFPDPVAVEAEIGRLQLEVQALGGAGEWEDVLALLRAMAAVDADHPKPYLHVALMQKARRALDEAASIMATLGAAEGPGPVYGGGVVQHMKGKPEEAWESYLRALEMYRKLDHAAGQAACLTALGNIDRTARRHDEAAERYEAARALLEGIGDRLGKADVLSNLAKVEHDRGRYLDSVRRQREEVLPIRLALGDAEGQAQAWQEIGLSLFRAGQIEAAMEALGEDRSIRKASSDRSSEVRTIRLMANFRKRSGDLEASHALLQEALGIAREAGDPGLQAQVHSGIGTGYLAAGRDSDAVEAFENAASLFHEAGDRKNETAAQNRVGATLRQLGEFERARTVLEAARREAEALGDKSRQAAILTELGAVHRSIWELTDALATQERALALHREIGRARGELINVNNLGAIHHSLGNEDEARRHLEMSLELAEKLSDDAGRARGYQNRGVLRGLDGELEAALDDLRRSEAIWRELDDLRGAAGARANTGEVLAALGRPDEAREHLDDALRIGREEGDRFREASTLNLIAALELAGGQAKPAEASFRAALAITGDHGFAEEEWIARAGLGSALEKQGRHDAAVQQALLALDRVESVRSDLRSDAFKVSFLAGRIDLYEQTLSLMLGTHDGPDPASAASALQVAERARARGLLDLLAESRAGLRESIDPELRRREDLALDHFNAATVRLLAAGDPTTAREARTRLEEAEKSLRALEQEIRVAAPRYGAIVYPRPASSETIRATLAADEVLLEYFVGSGQAWLWVVSGTGITVQALPSPEKLTEATMAFLERASRSASTLGAGGARHAAERLAGMLLPRSGLPAARRILVVPDGPLHHVPFEALVHGGRFLVEDHEVAVVPSATTLSWMRDARSASTRTAFLGLSGPEAGDGSTTTPLPYSRMEVERIAELFDESARVLLTGADATKESLESLELDRYRFIHFATHGLIDDHRRNVGLYLRSRGDRGPSLLSPPEILTMRLRADLVVLSACRSGLGELLRGEGLISLTRSFLYAGSRSVLVSLWNVSDESAVDFMEKLYQSLQAGDSPAAALRQAKLSFIRSDRPARRQAYRWASFVLVGEPGPLEIDRIGETREP